MLKTLIEKTAKASLDEFFEFLKIPSVSSEPSHKKDVLRAAEVLEKKLGKMGFSVERWETSGHPTLFASWEKWGKKRPTLLIYNHYDVQPVDPIDKWHSPPFQPEIREGQIYARGAEDNKGQLWYVLWALELLLETKGELPVNVKLCIEGEEEMGSKGLAALLKEKKQALNADFLAIVDVGIPNNETPAVTLGVRGIVALQVDVTGSSTDLHSGSHGGIVYNPLHALIEMLAKVRGADGKVAIPGFYDNVGKMHTEGLTLDFDEEDYVKITGARPSGGEKGFSPYERAWLRPTLEVNGFWGGYTGEGFKTVIPSTAHAKISCRLVGDQEPEEMGMLVKQYFEKSAPPGIKVAVTLKPGGGRAVRAAPNSKVVKAFEKSFSEVFNKPCKKIFEGGSIPIVTELAKAAGAEVVLIGLGLISDQVHAPNEHFGVDRIKKGALIIARGLEILGES